MKKIFMTLVAAVVAVIVNAQVFIGGGVGFANTSNGDDDVTTYKFMPEVGYTFNEDWAAGVAFGWEGLNKGGVKTVSVNPYVRMNLVKSGMVNVFIDGSVGYAHTYNAGYDQDEFSVGLKPGVAFNLNSKLSFVTHIGFIGYEHEKDNNTKAKLNTWGVDVDGSNIIFGVYYNF